MLRSERAAWSNITGLEPLPPKEDIPPPAHYTWTKDDWCLDATGPWIDDVLGIGKLEILVAVVLIFKLPSFYNHLY